jgi:hypothetical protein
VTQVHQADSVNRGQGRRSGRDDHAGAIRTERRARREPQVRSKTMSPKRTCSSRSGGGPSGTVSPEPGLAASSFLDRIRDLAPTDAVIFATWRQAPPIPAELSDAATTLLDESLRRIVSAELPDGAIVGSWGPRHVLAILPSTTPTAAARAARRARRAWKSRWNAPVHCSAAAVRGGSGALALAEEGLTVATGRRTGAVVLVDAAPATARQGVEARTAA